MSYLDHRCVACSHQKMWHADRNCEYGSCRCNLTIAEFGPPEMFITQVSATGEVNETLTEPGQWVFYPNDKTCDCAQCRAAFGEAVDVEW